MCREHSKVRAERERWLFRASCAAGTGKEPELEQGPGGCSVPPRLCYTPVQ